MCIIQRFVFMFFVFNLNDSFPHICRRVHSRKCSKEKERKMYGFMLMTASYNTKNFNPSYQDILLSVVLWQQRLLDEYVYIKDMTMRELCMYAK